MMFTIALSFLIFAGSTFSLMALMINQTLQSLFAADLYATTVMSSYYLNEQRISEFLDVQKSIDGAVLSYSYASPELSDFIEDELQPEDVTKLRYRIASASGYASNRVDVYAVEENFL